MYRIFAGIITYNPDIDRLRDNISSVLRQVQGLIVVDNCSDNIAEVKKLIAGLEASDCMQETEPFDIELIDNKKNMGMAYALNQIMHSAYTMDKGSWVLTLDQDTVVYDNIIEMYRNFIDTHMDDASMKAASLTCLRKDRNYIECNRNGEPEHSRQDSDYSLVRTCITSGNLVSAAAWYGVKGYDSRLFIDMVDDDFCLRLGEADYDIVRINQYGYLHEMGDNLIKVNVLGIKKTVFAYTPIRKYYTARNTVYIIRRYKLGIFNQYSLYLVRRILGTLLFEKNRLKGLAVYMKGFSAGFKLKCTK